MTIEDKQWYMKAWIRALPHIFITLGVCEIWCFWPVINQRLWIVYIAALIILNFETWVIWDVVRDSSEKQNEAKFYLLRLMALAGVTLSIMVVVIWAVYTYSEQDKAIENVSKGVTGYVAIAASLPTLYTWMIKDRKQEKELAQKDISELNKVYVDAVNQFDEPKTFLAGSYALIGLINSWFEFGTSTAYSKAHQIIYILFSKRTALRENIPTPDYLKTSEYSLFENLISELFSDEKYLPLYKGTIGLKFHLIDMSNLKLDNARLNKANLLNVNLSEANLKNADLRGANLREANLTKADLFGANLKNADLSKANPRGANLRGTSLRGANLNKADLREADLSRADLFGANLKNADLREADLSGADLSGANLKNADLRGADIQGADLSGANLTWADIQGSNLRGAFLTEAVLIGVHIQGADLRGANLIHAKIDLNSLNTATLSDEQLESIVIIDPKKN